VLETKDMPVRRLSGRDLLKGALVNLNVSTRKKENEFT
jgi:hypothetical protein